MHNRVFFSWKSDGDKRNTTRIVKYLNELAEEIGFIYTEYPADGISGSPDIPNIIHEKIKTSSVFIADLSKTGERNEKEITCNSNVLLETGYASSILHREQIIILSDYPGNLPFDIRNFRASPININKETLKTYIITALGYSNKEQLKRMAFYSCNACGNHDQSSELIIHPVDVKCSEPHVVLCKKCDIFIGSGAGICYTDDGVMDKKSRTFVSVEVHVPKFIAVLEQFFHNSPTLAALKKMCPSRFDTDDNGVNTLSHGVPIELSYQSIYEDLLSSDNPSPATVLMFHNWLTELRLTNNESIFNQVMTVLAEDSYGEISWSAFLLGCVEICNYHPTMIEEDHVVSIVGHIVKHNIRNSRNIRKSCIIQYIFRCLLDTIVNIYQKKIECASRFIGTIGVIYAYGNIETCRQVISSINHMLYKTNSRPITFHKDFPAIQIFKYIVCVGESIREGNSALFNTLHTQISDVFDLVVDHPLSYHRMRI